MYYGLETTPGDTGNSLDKPFGGFWSESIGESTWQVPVMLGDRIRLHHVGQISEILKITIFQTDFSHSLVWIIKFPRT